MQPQNKFYNERCVYCITHRLTELTTLQYLSGMSRPRCDPFDVKAVVLALETGRQPRYGHMRTMRALRRGPGAECRNGSYVNGVDVNEIAGRGIEGRREADGGVLDCCPACRIFQPQRSVNRKLDAAINRIGVFCRLHCPLYDGLGLERVINVRAEGQKMTIAVVVETVPDDCYCLADLGESIYDFSGEFVI
jgi:hypothetical protein